VVATWAAIDLRGFVRLHVPYLDVVDVVKHGRSYGTDSWRGSWSSGQTGS
jgi:hypothetical protein